MPRSTDDIEFYLRKFDPYTVPASFERVNLPSEPLSGDRISLLTFGFMYFLMATGSTSAYVNPILEDDGLVVSEAEQAIIMDRIDDYNAAIRSLAAKHGAGLIDIGPFLNDSFLGTIQSRSWESS